MKHFKWLVLLAVASCAGTARGCASCSAQRFGADWIVVQRKFDGSVMKCWLLDTVSIANEPGSDGIYWQDSKGHLLHLSGWYDRIQVAKKDWAGAADSLGVGLEKCAK